MKKVVLIALSVAVATSAVSCNKKAAATPGEAAKKYTEHIMNDDYDALVKAIKFTETTAADKAKAAVKPDAKPAARASTRTARHPDVTRAAKPAASKTAQRAIDQQHAAELRTVHHPDVTERGGIKEVIVVSETPAADNTYDVVVSNVYNNGLVEEIAYKMEHSDNDWKIRVTDNKEVWRATTSEGDREVIKLREDKAREFLKDKEDGERRFVKDIHKRNGQIEVIKTLENGERHREVIKNLDEFGDTRHIDKVKVDGQKIDVKDIERGSKEIIKEKDNLDGNHERVREVIR